MNCMRQSGTYFGRLRSLAHTVFLILALSSFFASCASSAKNEAKTAQAQRALESAFGENAPVQTVISAKIFPSYFRGVDTAVLRNIQNGSPSSVRRAVASVRKANQKYSEQEKVLLAVCASIFKHVWQNEKITWEVPAPLPDNLYTSTLNSVAQGVYVFSSASDDIFMLVLPSLILPSSVTDGFYDAAETSLDKALTINPDSVLALYLAGTLKLRLKKSDEALALLERAARFESNNTYLTLALIQALSDSGQTERAYETAKKLLASEPQNTDVLKQSAEAAFKALDYASAENLAARILQREPDNLHFLLFRAKILFQLEDYLSVSALLDAYARNDKTAKEYLLLRAHLQTVWNKNISAALVSVQEALSRYPNDTEVLLLAAETASASAQNINSQTAAQLAARVLEKDRHNNRALNVLTKDAVLKKNWEKAYEYSSEASREQPFTLDTALAHVQICLSLGKTEEARSVLKEFYTAGTKNEQLQRWYIRLLIAEGKKKEAAALINTLLPGAAGKMKSVLYYERSRLDDSDAQSLSDLRSSLTSNPRNEDALYDLYAYYYRRADYRKAQYYLKQVIALNPADTAFLKLNSELERLLK